MKRSTGRASRHTKVRPNHEIDAVKRGRVKGNGDLHQRTANLLTSIRSNGPIVVIDSRKRPLKSILNEVWEYRELLYFLVWRNVKVRYKQTALGASWAILQPVLAMVIFSLFLGHFAQIPSEGVPYPVFVFAALLPWQLFAYALTEAGNSLVVNHHLVTKVFFPRLVLPISSVGAGLVDFAFAFVVLLGMMLYFTTLPTVAIVALPAFLLLAVTTALSVGLWLSALNVRYRDVRYAIPFLLQFWLFATPIAYPSSLVPNPWRALYGLNPMAGVVEGFRWSLLGTERAPGAIVFVSAGVVFLGLIGSVIYFRRTETFAADLI